MINQNPQKNLCGLFIYLNILSKRNHAKDLRYIYSCLAVGMGIFSLFNEKARKGVLGRKESLSIAKNWIMRKQSDVFTS